MRAQGQDSFQRTEVWGRAGQIEDFGKGQWQLPQVLNEADAVCSELAYLGLIAVRGPDAEQFLQGQLTCDVRQATTDRTLLGAWCSPKGRVLVCLRLFRIGETLHLEMPRELVEPTLNRLRRHVLRSRVMLDDAGPALSCLGLAGWHAADLLSERLGAAPDAVYRVLQYPLEEGTCITVMRVPTTHVPRFAVYGSPSAVHNFCAGLKGKRVVFTDAQLWRLLDILAGLPAVYPETVETFIPQMINLDVLGGVSWKKGCYTGQEVVARAHYLGKVKRRMILAWGDSAPPPQRGEALYSPALGLEQNAGLVADVAPSPGGGYAVLAVVRQEGVEEGSLRLRHLEGPLLYIRPLPYRL